MDPLAEYLVEQATAALAKLSEEDRLVVLRKFCGFCGIEQPETGTRCQCWNDE